MSPSPPANPDSDVMLAASFGGSEGNSEYFKFAENSPTSSDNTRDLEGHISELETMHEVRTTLIFSHTDELEFLELADADINPNKNLQDNGAMPPDIT